MLSPVVTGVSAAYAEPGSQDPFDAVIIPPAISSNVNSDVWVKWRHCPHVRAGSMLHTGSMLSYIVAHQPSQLLVLHQEIEVEPRDGWILLR
jgi:hypothetical protein